MTFGSDNPSSQPDKRRSSSSKNLKMKQRIADFDSESGGSSEEFGSDSPRSVWKSDDGGVNNNNSSKAVQHHQVRRIREEDSHLGEDIGEGLSAKEKKLAILKSNLDAFFLRENHGFILHGASPLSGKNAIKSFN